MVGGLKEGIEFPTPIPTVWLTADSPPHEPSPRPKKWYVTVPLTPLVGNPPDNVAWSTMVVPAVTVVPGLSLVVTVGLALITVSGSHRLFAPLFFESPEYTALKL